jgi:hypothetical protein
MGQQSTTGWMRATHRLGLKTKVGSVADAGLVQDL